jgi:hypothetical protein
MVYTVQKSSFGPPGEEDVVYVRHDRSHRFYVFKDCKTGF